MKVFAVDNTKYSNKTSFKSCLRTYTPNKTNLNYLAQGVVRTSTYMLREDLNWNFFVKYLLFHFLEKPKVNIYSLASSDGSESYSCAISLMEKIPDNLYKKFFPIFSSDIDKHVINAAKSRRINIHDYEFDFAQKYNGIDLHRYFEHKDKPLKIKDNMDEHLDKKSLNSYSPIEELANLVRFKQADLLTVMKEIKDDGNSVVMCRNVLPYLNENYIESVVKNASEVLKKGSLFITGEFDDRVDITAKLLQNGFYRPVIEHTRIFQKL